MTVHEDKQSRKDFKQGLGLREKEVGITSRRFKTKGHTHLNLKNRRKVNDMLMLGIFDDASMDYRKKHSEMMIQIENQIHQRMPPQIRYRLTQVPRRQEISERKHMQYQSGYGVVVYCELQIDLQYLGRMRAGRKTQGGLDRNLGQRKKDDVLVNSSIRICKRGQICIHKEVKIRNIMKRFA